MKLHTLALCIPMVFLWVIPANPEVRAATAQARAYGTQTIDLDINAAAQTTLAAFTPVEEAQWSPGWEPVFSRPDRASDEGSVFTTIAHSEQVIWLLDRYDRLRREIRYLEVQPGRTLTRIDIKVSPHDAHHSSVRLTYERTSLSPKGDEDVHRFMAHFTSQRAHWEQVLNDFVSAGAPR